MDFRHPSGAVLAVLALLVLLAAAGFGAWLASWWRRFGLATRFARGREAEREAEEYLRGSGFRILERQARGRLEYKVDGRMETAEVFADYIVEKDGVRYLVEVKSGEQAVDPEYPATRRQLLEYALAFENSNLMLLDMEARAAHRIEFPCLEADSGRPIRFWMRWFLGFFLLGTIVGMWLMSRIR